MSRYDGHLDLSEFQRAFPTWSDLENRLRQLSVSTPEFSVERAKRQLILGDLLSQLNQGGDAWHATGSITLQAHAAEWSSAGGQAPGDIDPVYVMARTANDLDVYNAELDSLSDDEYVSRVSELIRAVAPQGRGPLHGAEGLGGLVRYTTRNVEFTGSGHAVFSIDVQPVKRTGPGPLGVQPDGDRFSVEIDVKMPSMIQRSSEPERARRSLVGVDLPGLQPITPLLRPVADLAADKLAALACRPGVGDGIAAPRFKDVFDLYYLARTCPIDGDRFRKAMATNWHWPEAGLSGPPSPYRFYGQSPAQDGELEILWENGTRQLRERGQMPQLKSYPEFAEMVRTISAFVDGAADPSNGAWDPARGEWRQSVHSEVSTAMSHALAPASEVDVEQPGFAMQKHLFVFDVDQTLSKFDTLNQLADLAGLRQEVEAAGDPDYETSIRRKVAVLAGVDASLLDQVADGVELNEGAQELIEDLRNAGHEVAIASGGFLPIVAPLARRLGVEHFVASDLEIVDGKLTGRLRGDLVDGPGKAEAIRGWNEELDIPRERTIAVGDGSNDVDMFKAVGLAAGYNPSAAAAADSHTHLLRMDQLRQVVQLPERTSTSGGAVRAVASVGSGARRDAGEAARS
jgi:phosphoserine phosphatase SerB